MSDRAAIKVWKEELETNIENPDLKILEDKDEVEKVPEVEETSSPDSSGQRSDGSDSIKES